MGFLLVILPPESLQFVPGQPNYFTALISSFGSSLSISRMNLFCTWPWENALKNILKNDDNSNKKVNKATKMLKKKQNKTKTLQYNMLNIW